MGDCLRRSKEKKHGYGRCEEEGIACTCRFEKVWLERGRDSAVAPKPLLARKHANEHVRRRADEADNCARKISFEPYEP